MIAKPSSKAAECAAFADLIAGTGFERLPERARKDAMKRKRGLEGERQTAHILDRHFHATADHALLHDLRLPDGIGGFAQFDHVILSRLSRTATVVEVKNYRGRLSKNAHNEWCVWYEGRHRPIDIPNPLAQAVRQKDVLRAWLNARRHDVAFEKIRAFVIIPPDCSIDRSKVGHDVAIYKADNFITAWTEFGGISGFGKMFSSGVSAASLAVIAGQLAADDVPDPRRLEDLIGLRSMPLSSGEGASGGSATRGGLRDLAIEEGPTEPGVAFTAPGPVGAVSVAERIIDPALAVSALGIVPIVASKKAMGKIQLVPGIFERILPDGRVAFLAGDADDSQALLGSVCTGVASWNPRYRNWLSTAENAGLIRAALVERAHPSEIAQDGVPQSPGGHRG